MTDTDKVNYLEYEGCIADMKGYDLAVLAEELLAEVRRLRKQVENCKRQIKETADLMRDRGEGLHATDLDNFLEWME